MSDTWESRVRKGLARARDNLESIGDTEVEQFCNKLLGSQKLDTATVKSALAELENLPPGPGRFSLQMTLEHCLQMAEMTEDEGGTGDE